MTKTERNWILYDVANSAYTLTIKSTVFPIFYKTYIAGGLPSYESTAHIGYANNINTLVILFPLPILGTLAFFLPTLPAQGMKVIMFRILAMLVATSRGSMQALSRSMIAKMIPKNKSAEFFGFYNIFGKFSTLFGLFIIGAITAAIIKESRLGILSIIILFTGGGIALMFVKPESKESST